MTYYIYVNEATSVPNSFTKRYVAQAETEDSAKDLVIRYSRIYSNVDKTTTKPGSA